VGLEPAVVLTYRDEYLHALGREAKSYEVQLLQEYLCQHMSALTKSANTIAPPRNTATQYQLFGHCTERTFEPKSQAQWVQVFSAFGLGLATVGTGCCGMCGVYGHEAEHLDDSRGVFDMSWRKALPQSSEQRSTVLATGHSCRSQVKRFEGFVPRHPVEALASFLSAE
jgi:Fe-S oxidoreductase